MLLLGETGTGKESLARHIHEASRRKGRMLSINCGGLEPSLAFSELFGHTANAFTDANYHELGLLLRASGYKQGNRQARGNSQTFADWLIEGNPDVREDKDGLLTSDAAEADSGTLFLDEVATLPRKVMAGLLRVLSTSDVSPFGYHGSAIRTHCRIIAATNEMSVLEASIAHRQDEVSAFRRDLCYRLGGAILTLAPLRERDPEDIRHYVERTVWGQLELQEMPVEVAAVDYIVALFKGRTDDTARQYQLGNFRSLRNLVYRSALIAIEDRAPSVTLTHVELSVQHGQLLVGQSEAINQERHIRETFRRALLKLDIQIDEDFSWEELKELTNKKPIEVGYAFLQSCLKIKLAPSRGYYQLSEIQRALARGVVLNAWLGKSLRKEHVLKAAAEYCILDASGWPSDISVSAIVQRAREAK
jgi:transcriptional regulator with AAA-type ATPase domain